MIRALGRLRAFSGVGLAVGMFGRLRSGFGRRRSGWLFRSFEIWF